MTDLKLCSQLFSRLDVSPKSSDARGTAQINVKSTVTNCGSALANFTVVHDFTSSIWVSAPPPAPIHSCLQGLTAHSVNVSLAPGESTVIQFERNKPGCLGTYTAHGKVREFNAIVAEHRSLFAITQKTHRKP